MGRLLGWIDTVTGQAITRAACREGGSLSSLHLDAHCRLRDLQCHKLQFAFAPLPFRNLRGLHILWHCMVAAWQRTQPLPARHRVALRGCWDPCSFQERACKHKLHVDWAGRLAHNLKAGAPLMCPTCKQPASMHTVALGNRTRQGEVCFSSWLALHKLRGIQFRGTARWLPGQRTLPLPAHRTVMTGCCEPRSCQERVCKRKLHFE